MSDTTMQGRDKQQMNGPERINEGVTFTPLVDIIETKEEFIFQADLPGVKAGDVDLFYENGELTISGKLTSRQPEQTNYIWHEYGVGNFFRQFTLGVAINADKIKASLTNGVLEMHVPKPESAKTRKVAIRTN